MTLTSSLGLQVTNCLALLFLLREEEGEKRFIAKTEINLLFPSVFHLKVIFVSTEQLRPLRLTLRVNFFSVLIFS